MKKNILSLVLLFRISTLLCQNWSQDQFMIGTFVDPRLSTSTNLNNTTQVTKDVASYTLAKNAYFNLFTGFQDDDRVVNTKAGMTYALTIANTVGMKYLVRDNRISTYIDESEINSIVTNVTNDYKALPSNLRSTMIGYAVKDEPGMDLYGKIAAYCDRFKISDSTKLAYINLNPIYGFLTYAEYENYLDLFIGKSTVVSFDHYLKKDYYYNLKVVKKKAGIKPFWVYPNSTFTKGVPAPVPSAATLQLQAFAPLAYGAKGLIYFTYETPNTYKWLIDFNKDGWDTISDKYRSEDHEIAAVGDYDGDGRADIAVKSDIGNWKIDYSDDGFNGWEETWTSSGAADAHPAPADYDGDGKTDLSVKTDDGRWLINYAVGGFAGGWNDTYLINEWANAHPVPADYDGDGRADLSVKVDDGRWRINYSTDGFTGGWNVTYTGYGDANAHPFPADYDGDGKADLSVKTDDGRWLINYSIDGFAGGWQVNIDIGSTPAHAAPADYDNDGRTDISVKTDSGSWKINYASNGFASGWDLILESYGNSSFLPVPADYDGNGKVDLSVRGVENTFRNSLINPQGNPNPLYTTAKSINLYASSVVGPMIMSCNHIGAFHKTLPANNNLNSDDLLTAQSLVKDVSSNDILIGLFREKAVVQNTITYYLFVVNTSTTALPSCLVTLNGNYTSRVFTTQSFSKNYTNNPFTPLSTSYHLGNTTKFYIPDGLLAGEGRLIKVTRVKHAVKYDFDGDGISDLNQKKDNGKWYIDYATEGFCSWNETLIESGGADAHPATADYDGDGRADISVKADEGSWFINYSSGGFTGGWNETYIANGGADAHPVPGDYDGDGKEDLSVKTDDGRWLINYAAGSFLGGWNDTYISNGGADAHPVPADYDGDGKTDLSVKTDDGRWLINYSTGGFLGGWNDIFTGYGAADQHPVPADYDGDGKDDISLKTDNGKWMINYANNGFNGGMEITVTGCGGADSKPFPGDYDGDGRYDLALRTADNKWKIDYAKNGFGYWDLECTVTAPFLPTEVDELSQDVPNGEVFIYSIYNLEGKEVMTLNRRSTINDVKTNCNLKTGIYLLRTLENNKINVRKIFIDPH